MKQAPEELKDKSKKIFSKTQELLKIAEAEGEKGILHFKKMFKKVKKEIKGRK